MEQTADADSAESEVTGQGQAHISRTAKAALRWPRLHRRCYQANMTRRFETIPRAPVQWDGSASQHCMALDYACPLALTSPVFDSWLIPFWPALPYRVRRDQQAQARVVMRASGNCRIKKVGYEMPRPEANKCRRQARDSQRSRALIVVAQQADGSDEANAWKLHGPRVPFAPVHQRLISSNIRTICSQLLCRHDSNLAWILQCLFLGCTSTADCQQSSGQTERRGPRAVPLA